MMEILEEKYGRIEINTVNCYHVVYIIGAPYKKSTIYMPELLSEISASIDGDSKERIKYVKENGLCDALFEAVKSIL